MMKRGLGLVLGLALTSTTALAQPAPPPAKAELRSIFKEMVETDTSVTTGSCTLAAERVARGEADIVLHQASDPHPAAAATGIRAGTRQSMHPTPQKTAWG